MSFLIESSSITYFSFGCSLAFLRFPTVKDGIGTTHREETSMAQSVGFKERNNFT